MSPIDTSKIEIGAGDLYIKEAGAGDYTFTGASLDAELNPSVERKNIECAQVPGPVKGPIVGTKVLFKVQLLERSLRNLILGVGGDPVDITAGSGYEEFKWGGKFADIELDVKYEVPQVDDRTKKDYLYIWKAKAINGYPLPYKKKNETIFEITFEGFVDSSNDNHMLAIRRET